MATHNTLTLSKSSKDTAKGALNWLIFVQWLKRRRRSALHQALLRFNTNLKNKQTIITGMDNNKLQGHINIFIRDASSGTSTAVLLNMNETIIEVKNKIFRLGLAPPPSQQRLTFSGEQLHDGSPVSACGIKDGSVLHLVAGRLLGGGGSGGGGVAAGPPAPPPLHALGGAGASPMTRSLSGSPTEMGEAAPLALNGECRSPQQIQQSLHLFELGQHEGVELLTLVQRAHMSLQDYGVVAPASWPIAGGDLTPVTDAAVAALNMHAAADRLQLDPEVLHAILNWARVLRNAGSSAEAGWLLKMLLQPRVLLQGPNLQCAEKMLEQLGQEITIPDANEDVNMARYADAHDFFV